MDDVEKSGIISAIWILACNDEKSFMLYESVRHRVGLSESFDVKNLIKQYAELFRPNIPKKAMDMWKADMLAKKRRPSYIIDITDEVERNKIIESLTFEDGFRTQFRTKADSPRSEIILINWGLEHIERLRKAKIEAKDLKWKKTKELWIPLISILASILIALGTIIITSYWQFQNIQTQKEIKKLEVSFKPKQEGYSEFMKSISVAFQISLEGALEQGTDKKLSSLSEMRKQIDNSEKAFYLLEPFIEVNARKMILDKLYQFRSFLTNIAAEREKSLEKDWIDQQVKQQVEYQMFFREKLTSSLFNNEKFDLK